MSEGIEHAAPLSAEELLGHAAWIRRLAGRLVGEDGADDLAQDALVAALDRPVPPRDVRGWLAGVTRNLARFGGRSEANRRARERGGAEREPALSSAELTQRAELQRLVVDLVLALDEPYRETLLLRYYEGLSPAQIAARRGEPAATVRSRTARGIEQVRVALDARHGGQRGPWLSVLLPLALERGAAITPWSLVAGAAAMKSTQIAAGAVLIALAAMLALRQFDGDADAGSAEGIARAALPPLSEDDGDSGDEGPGAAGTLEADAPAGDPKEDVSTAQPATERTAIEPEEARPVTAPVRGQVLDERTGEPAPYLRFDLVHGERREEIATDAEGRFESAEDYPAGPLAIDLSPTREPRDAIQGSGRDEFRDWSWDRTVDVAVEPDGTSAPLDLQLPVGPTYTLRVSAPEAVAFDGLKSRLVAADPRFAWDHIYGSVRVTGGVPWVRFSPVACLTSGGPPYRLLVGTADGLWFGEAQVEPVVGRHPGVLEVELSARGSVRGTLLAPDGTGVARAWAQLWPEGGTFDTGDPSKRPKFAVTAEDGAYEHLWLAPGRYTLKSEAEDCEVINVPIEIVAGEIIERDLVFERLSAANSSGVVAGIIESETGTFHDPLRVIVQKKGGGPRQLAEVSWSEVEGRWVGSFEATDVVATPQIVSIDGAGFLDTEPGYPEVDPTEAAAKALKYLVYDDLVRDRVTVRARDAETGEEVSWFKAWLTADPLGAARQVYGLAAGEPTNFEGVPTERPWEVRVAADGYAMAWGDASDFDAETGEIVVELRRGWSSRLQVRGEDRERLAGVLVTVDGEVAGRTDENGYLIVHRPEEPSAVQFELDGWEPVADSVYNPETGGFRSFLWYQRVTMRRSGG